MSCPGFCDFGTNGQAISGSCVNPGFPETAYCTVGTTVRLLLLGVFIIEDNDYVGSPFLTCTNDGWFPPPPRCDSCRVGKYKMPMFKYTKIGFIEVKFNITQFVYFISYPSFTCFLCVWLTGK